ncbi:tetratricopeptide repeat protein [Helicobacter bizzozeronii]|uniref:tetratricopeptide repeat protein n=1 Tax=Helicobacter bizzozeronii TaxID=56877 RepID=UPI000CF0EE15|nr:hypothetical protein [Helicobacter bizzozeronii]
MLDVLEIAKQLQTSSASQAGTDLNIHYSALKEVWEQYAPLKCKQDLQNKAFEPKNIALYKLLETCKYDILPFCVRLAPEDVGLQTAQEVQKEMRSYSNKEGGSCHTPYLEDYQEQERKFKEAFGAFCQHLDPFLKDTPQLSQAEKLQGWFVFVELERGRCLEAWQKFYKLYKEECKAKGVKKLIYRDMEEATKEAYEDFEKSHHLLIKGLKQLLACANRVGGVHLLEAICRRSSAFEEPRVLIWTDEEGLEKLLELKEAVGAVVSTDAKVLEAKEVLEQKITQCQEELPKCLALLEQAKDKSLKEQNTIKKPFEKLQESLKTDIQTLFEASDESLGVAVVRQIGGVANNMSSYDKSGFKTTLEKQVLKALEEYFKTLGIAPTPQSALNALRVELQENNAQIPVALAQIEQTHQELVKEGIVTSKETRTLYDSLDEGLEPLKESLKAFVAGSEDKNIAKIGAEALKNVRYVSDLEKALPIIENMLKASHVSPPSAAMASTQELKALKARQNIADLKAQFQTFKGLWARYKPLEDQQKRQEQVFKAKRQVLYDLLDYKPLEVLWLYKYSIEDKDTQKALDECYWDWRVESGDVPYLDAYPKDKQEFQDKLNGFSRGVADLLATAPQLTEPERLKGWWHFIELKRLACQEAYSTFIRLYKEACQAKGKKSIGYRNIDGEAEKAWNALESSLYSFNASLGKLFLYTACVSGVGALRSLVREYTGAYAKSFSCNDGEGLQQLLGFQEAANRIKSADERVLGAKGVLEQRIAQCQERLQECNALLSQEGITWEQEEEIKKPFEEACKGLILEAQAVLEVVDMSLGMAQARQAQSIIRAREIKQYNTPAFQKTLEDGVLKPLEERFLSFGETPSLQVALDTFKSALQIALQEITEAFLDLEPTYQQLQAEGLVDQALCSELKESMRSCVEPLRAGVGDLFEVLDKNTAQQLKKVWGDFYKLWSGREKSAPDEVIFGALEAELDSLEHLSASQKSDALKALEQTHAFLDSRHAIELERNDVCVHLANLQRGLKTLQQEIKALQATTHQDQEGKPNTTGVEKAQKNAQKELKNLLELLDPSTAKELTALSAHLDTLAAQLSTQEKSYYQEQQHQEANLEDQALENALKTLKEGFRQNVLEGLGQLEAKISSLHTALESFKASGFFKDLIKPLWFYQGDNLRAYGDYWEASQKDNPQALLELGKMTLEGVVVMPSVSAGRELLLKAAKLGSIRAVAELGLSYLGAGRVSEPDAKEAFDYLSKALILGDVKAYVGLEKLRHFEEFEREMDTLNDALVKNALKPCGAENYFGFNDYIKSPSKADYDAWLALQEVQGECAHHHHFHQDAHIDKDYGIDPDYREYYIESFFEDFFDHGLCATMQGYNARLHLSILKTIETVYGKPTKEDYKKAYENAQEAYLEGIALGSGRCALELAQLELEQPKHFNLSPKKAQSALLEANHRAIGCFKQALERGYNTALVPLTNTLGRQKELLAKTPDHPLHAFLAKYESDSKEVASLAPTFIDKSVGFGGKLDVKAHFSPTFWQHPDLESLEVKQEQKPVSTLKPLWQYGSNTQQAFKDYMEAKEKGDALAWLYLGVMSLQGVVVPPDPHGGAVACFLKARDLGTLLGHYGLYLTSQLGEYYGDDVEIFGDKCPNYQHPLKPAEVPEGLEQVFPLGNSAEFKASYMAVNEARGEDYESRYSWSWVFGEGLVRGQWCCCDEEWGQDKLANLLETIHAQGNDDASMYAWEGFARMAAGAYDSCIWGLHLLKAREQKNLLRYHANRSYQNIQQAIQAGFVDGYYFLGAEGIHDRSGFYASLQMVRSVVIEDVGNDEFDGEIYGGEEDYLEGLAPEDPKDDGKEFYAKKCQESLEQGAKAGSALCAVALAKRFLRQGDKDFNKCQELLELLTPFWEQQHHYGALAMLLQLLKVQIPQCKGKQAKELQSRLDAHLAHLEKIGCDPSGLEEYYKAIGVLDWMVF